MDTNKPHTDDLFPSSAHTAPEEENTTENGEPKPSSVNPDGYDWDLSKIKERLAAASVYLKNAPIIEEPGEETEDFSPEPTPAKPQQTSLFPTEAPAEPAIEIQSTEPESVIAESQPFPEPIIEATPEPEPEPEPEPAIPDEPVAEEPEPQPEAHSDFLDAVAALEASFAEEDKEIASIAFTPEPTPPVEDDEPIPAFELMQDIEQAAPAPVVTHTEEDEPSPQFELGETIGTSPIVTPVAEAEEDKPAFTLAVEEPAPAMETPAEPEPVIEPQPAEPEPVTAESQPLPEPEPILEPEPEPIPEPVIEASPQPEPIPVAQPVVAPEPAPVMPSPIETVAPTITLPAEPVTTISIENALGIDTLHAPSEEDEAHYKKLPLGQRLIKKGLISPDQLQIALREQGDGPDRKMLGAILVELGFITESALGEILTETSGVGNFNLKTAVLDSKLIKTVPKDIAMRCKALPVSIDNDTVTVAISDVYNILAIDQFRRFFPKQSKIVPVYAGEAEILEIIDQYHDYEMSVDGIIREIETGRTENNKLNGEEQGYVNPTVRLVDAILVDAIKAGASDIHFEPEGLFLRLRYRVDGQMSQIRSFHKDYWSAIAVRIKIMSNMNIAETRNPQDGRISYNVLGREIDFRVATQPTVHGENIVMRILDKKRSLVPLSTLGFSDENITLLKKLLKRPEGIIIVTGPTGSGKTTTLYSVLNYINSIDRNIMTLEDPVEYQLPLIRQSNVREGTGMNFVDGIRSLMRQDPDVIFIGEIRDRDTANMAVRAAMTGHQVFSTLHTNDALGAIPRLIDIGVPPHLLSGSLICLMAQRLARKLCPHCKKPRHATADECKILGIATTDAHMIHEPVGCPSCHNGYKGRVAVSEVLRIDQNMDEMIETGSPRHKIMEYAVENGFKTMAMDGVDKVLAGITSIDELIRTVDMTGRL